MTLKHSDGSQMPGRLAVLGFRVFRGLHLCQGGLGLQEDLLCLFQGPFWTYDGTIATYEHRVCFWADTAQSVKHVNWKKDSLQHFTYLYSKWKEGILLIILYAFHLEKNYPKIISKTKPKLCYYRNHAANEDTELTF